MIRRLEAARAGARRTAQRAALAMLAALGLAACSDPTNPAPAPITELPRALSASEREVLARSNAFAFALANELLPEAVNDNLFYSPLSASMVLGMLLNGADGRTYDQIRDVLAFQSLSQEQINQGYSDLMELLRNLDPSVTIELGNSVWTRLGFPVQPDFMSRVRTSFDAEAHDVDFADPGTLPRINRWASDATHGRIEEIFSELPPNVVMVLLNAIYFKANWVARFDRARTERAPFTRPDGSTVTADLMYLDGDVSGLQGDTFTMVELPYGGSAFSMVAALPAPGVSVKTMLQGLDAQGWDSRMSALSAGHAIVRLPRFELEWERKLNEPLQALGMTDAFDGGRANFTRLTPGGGVWLDLVKQKSYVKVDEEGTEAAAVTGAVVVESAPAEVRMDRPFLFVIRERLTGAILFLGIVNDPTA
jgi:serpin B